MHRTDLEQCTLMEMKEYSQAQHMNIKIADRIKLHRAVEILGNKARIINPEEIDILKSIDTKIQKFAKSISNLNSTQHSLQQQRKSIQMAINFGFNALIETLDNRKEFILKQFDDMIQERRQSLSDTMENSNSCMDRITKIREDCQILINQAIEMEELMARKDKLTEHKKTIQKIIHETNKQIGKAPKNDKINFVLDTKSAALVQ